MISGGRSVRQAKFVLQLSLDRLVVFQFIVEAVLYFSRRFDDQLVQFLLLIHDRQIHTFPLHVPKSLIDGRLLLFFAGEFFTLLNCHWFT